MQSPGYNAKALAIHKRFYPSDVQSASAQADYKKILELLKENNEDALVAFRKWRDRDAEADCDADLGDHYVTNP